MTQRPSAAMPQKAPAASQPKPDTPISQLAIEDPAKTAKPKMPDKKVLVLEFPVTFAGLEYTQLTVRRMKARDFRQLDVLEGGGNASAIAMAALICGVDEAVIDELDAVDYMRVQETINDFFPKALADKLQSKASL